MVNFLTLSFFLNFIYFLIAIVIAFYIPGSVILAFLKLRTLHKVILGTLTGMVLWGWQGLILGYLNLRFFSYIYLLIFIILWFSKNRSNLKRFKKNNLINKFKNLQVDKIILILIVIGVITQLSSVFFTGITTVNGIYYCCGNIPDNILNISITNAVVNHFPPFEPGYYGKILTNYHYWSSLVTGELIRVFKLPLVETNYQFMTIFTSISLGLSALVFGETLNLGKVFSRWLILFLYFGSDLIWIFIAFYRKQDFFAMSPLESGQQFLENIPRAMAVIIIFLGLSFFLMLLKRKDIRLGIILAFVFSSLVGFKVYLSFFIFPGLIILAILFLKKKNYIFLLSILLTCLLSAIIYIPVNSGAGGIYFTGLWRFENFIVQPYLGDLSRMEFARTIYSEHHNWLRVIQYEFTYILIFIVAIFGTKVIGLIQSKKSLLKFPLELHILLIPGVVSGFIIGSLFNQTSGGSNTFNFLVSIFILSSIYSALALSTFFIKNKKTYFVITLFILFLTLPRTLNQTYQNLKNIISQKGFVISNEELKGLEFLKNIKTNNLVLADPNLKMDKESPYISYISNQKMFLSGQGDELIAHNIYFADRLKDLNIILYSPNPASVSAVLKNNKIEYVFLLKNTRLASSESANFLSIIYNNKRIKILKFNKL